MEKFFVKGESGGYGNWIVLDFDLAGRDPDSLKKCLEELVSLTGDMRCFLECDASSDEDHEDPEMYLIRFRHRENLISEKEFFEECAEHPELHEKISEYVENVNSEAPEWQDEFHPRGSYAVTPLVLANESYARLFGRLFGKWDMEAETFQGHVVEMVFSRYGITEKTLPLLTLRTLSDGQGIEENLLRIMYGLGLRKRIDLHRFICSCIDECTENPELWTRLDTSLKDFAQIYAGKSEEVYRETSKLFFEALRSAGADPGDLADEYEVFEVHPWLDHEDLYKDLPRKDWNAGSSELAIYNYLKDYDRIRKC